jgi:hypothetical protein
MGTRACIARRTGTTLKGMFAGRYHHWDGYPDGLGKTLYELYNGHFKRDLKAMLKYLIDDHPAGWSTINGADFTQPPGFGEGGFKTEGPHCYCHGGRTEEEQLITELNASDCGCEYAYVFDVPKNEMLVLSSFWKKKGTKMIGMFGFGGKAKDVAWKIIGTVDLNGPEPKWELMGGEEAA